MCSNNPEKEISNIERLISKNAAKKQKLLDMRLDDTLDKDSFDIKFNELNEQLDELSDRLASCKNTENREKNIKKRLDDFRKVLEKNEVLVEFDRQVFESIIDKVIVGGYDDDGNKDPSMLTFVYKTGFTNSVDANNHKPPRKKRKKNKEKNVNKLSSYSPNEDEKMCSLNSDNTCGNGCINDKKIKYNGGIKKMKKNVFIMGDSYSTYDGYVPKGYHCYYFDERQEAPIIKGVEKTWWSKLAKENNLNIILNDSFSGSTICNTVREELTVESSFVSRIDKYINENFFTENKINTMFIFGGTNDSWIDAPVGNLKYSDWTDDDLKCVLPAFCYLINRAKEVIEDVFVIINTELKQEITQGFIEACEKNEIKCLCLKEIDKENGHPTELGMEQICEQVTQCLNK